MKKTLILIMMVIGMLGESIHAQDRHESHREHEAYEKRGYHNRSPYLVSNNKVFYEGKEIKGASALKFDILRDG